MNKSFIFLFLFCCQLVGAQDLLSLLEDDSSPQLVTSIFKDSRVVNAQSSKQSAKGELKFLIQHRFGTLNSGFYNLWGIDNSHVRMGFDYGVSDRFMVSLGRSSYNKQYDFSVKGKIAQQTHQFPIVISMFSGFFVTHPKATDRQADNFDILNHFSFTNQLIIARKFSSNFSLVILPTHIHRNQVKHGEPFDPLFLGVGGRYKITKKVSINSEYFYSFDELSEAYHNMLSFGFDIETGGHVFSLHMSNSRGMNEPTFLTETTGDWLDGDIYFGFNISRVFAW